MSDVFELAARVIGKELRAIKVRGAVITDCDPCEFLADFSVVYLQLPETLWECSVEESDCSLQVRAVAAIDPQLTWELEPGWQFAISDVAGHAFVRTGFDSHVNGVRILDELPPPSSGLRCRALQLFLASGACVFIDPFDFDGIALGNAADAAKWREENPQAGWADYGQCE